MGQQLCRTKAGHLWMCDCQRQEGGPSDRRRLHSTLQSAPALLCASSGYGTRRQLTDFITTSFFIIFLCSLLMAVSSNADVFAACLPLHSKAKLWRASNGRYMEKDAREEQGTRLAGSKKKKKKSGKENFMKILRLTSKTTYLSKPIVFPNKCCKWKACRRN